MNSTPLLQKVSSDSTTFKVEINLIFVIDVSQYNVLSNYRFFQRTVFKYIVNTIQNDFYLVHSQVFVGVNKHNCFNSFTF